MAAKTAVWRAADSEGIDIVVLPDPTTGSLARMADADADAARGDRPATGDPSDPAASYYQFSSAEKLILVSEKDATTSSTQSKHSQAWAVGSSRIPT
ncbi:hypothetical protein [Parafrankia sp. FMc2]|uniref:hypothetical protein n=1 Tax=Parafrankia sp. FMc2 TaxID=3233196 RepID=UPI0034D478A3